MADLDGLGDQLGVRAGDRNRRLARGVGWRANTGVRRSTRAPPADRGETPNELALLARRYRVAYTRVEGSAPQYYTMNHTATVFIFDEDGRIQRLAPYSAGVNDIEYDLRRLIDTPEGC